MSLKVGIQLYSVKNILAKNPYETLRQVAEAGYRYVEGANHRADEEFGAGLGMPARELRQCLDNFGLEFVGCHINPLSEETLPEVLDYHAELGNIQVGCDIEFYPYGDLDYLKRRCQFFNRVGELCLDRGMRFYYHNHFQEFQQFGGKYVYDLVMEHTDPGLVYAEMDTYWMARAGQDPVKWMKKYHDRLILLHQKDFPARLNEPLCIYEGIADPEENIDEKRFLEIKNPEAFTEIGTGALPISRYLTAAQSCPNLDYLLLEQDATKLDEAESIRVSMNAFREFQGLEF